MKLDGYLSSKISSILTNSQTFRIILLIVSYFIIVTYFRLSCSTDYVSNIPHIVSSAPVQDHVFLVKNGTVEGSSNVIAILIRGENYTDLGERLAQLDTRLRDGLSTPIIVFHNGYPMDSEIWEATRFTKREVTFHNVDNYFLKFPAGLNPYLVKPNWSIRNKWGYQHMIHFWFKIVFQLPEIRRYHYMMRLDSDSRIIGNWTNPFNLLATNRSVYLANFETLDHEQVLRGTLKLQDYVIDYVRSKNIDIQNPRNFQRAFNNESARTYWNNFEVLDICFFNQKNVTDWVDAIVQSQGIYKYRWGDAVLRFLTLAMFAKDDQVLHREEIVGLGYCHPC